MHTDPDTADLPGADFRAILRTWPMLIDVAADLDLSRYTVAAWKRRGFIPEEYWVPLEAAAARRGYTTVTYDRCRRAAAACRAERRARAAGSSAGALTSRRAKAADDDYFALYETIIAGPLRERLARDEAADLGPSVGTMQEDTRRCSSASFAATSSQGSLRMRRNDTWG